ncbi:hypothetical protein ESB00_05305 [Oleiharenicola lentus]|jgi:hypothetical protein|uniref:Uncharacterized protein n=1 Tax=Oleiharenicola lentus TaxID=2508720 RepID=A0A4Q1C8X0_9BACT|nr:hypothetical protein [Oleiharenicola lentus]RXK55316.1 hypothetical protein ESB00_05305 [Oleiharenicola lentus]
MKTPVLSAALFALMTAVGAGAGVSPGASLDEVRAVLGKPNGQMQLGARQVLLYERGSVELSAGRVTRVDLRSEEEQAVWAAREERLQTQLSAQRSQSQAEGTALRDRKLADAAFLASPVAYQVAFWEDFSRRYPAVPCAEPLTIARLKLSEQREEKARREADSLRLRELEARVAAAEAEREPVYYRVRSYPRYRDRYDYHQEFALWPVSYTYYDSPKPVYETPTTPVISPIISSPALPERRSYDGSQREHRGRGRDDHAVPPGRSDWRRAHSRYERM